MKRYIYLIALLAGLGACKKETVSTNGKNPYQETVLPAISINKDGINPVKGKVGDEVVIAGKGFEKNKDKLSILFNGVKAAVVSLTDTTIRVKVPAQAATGNVAATVGQQYFFGPFFRVLGTFEMDTTYPSLIGANGAIGDIIPVEDGKYLVVGDFTTFNGVDYDRNRVARINHNGTSDNSFGLRKNGTNTYVSKAAIVPGPEKKYLVAGAFNNYEGVAYVNSLALLNNNGTLAADKIILPSGKDLTVSKLKGGISGSVGNLHVQADGGILLTGSFRFYVQPNFQLTSSLGLDSVHLDSIQVNGMVRLTPDGGLDSTYNYDLVKHMGKEGPNGFINRSILLPDGKMLIAGNFTKYNGQTVNRIARLNADGSLDPTFVSGAGADQAIVNMARQADGKIVLVGGFNNFGGTLVPHIARINANGVVDPTFNAGKGSNGFFYDISFMPGGQIILSGIFSQFGDLQRNNIIVLNADGSIHPSFNTNGGITLSPDAVSGGIMKIVQQEGEKSMLLVGTFTRFDYRNANRIVRIVYP
ncbi:IPT/TIG domain-containing protein [Chitinophaga sp. 22321]|uniref:DUF5008 domain-containing protein n=1 Tax=Chitinophaga hostae TaxID=2831022 RepID=A0ABS5J8N0_9BACT|nr:IPT/TIG domain-containing protein [Chitinophaga hostae]MBS0031559.1 DUF5008 domain-containing protein [Chitinophaga hostae]